LRRKIEKDWKNDDIFIPEKFFFFSSQFMRMAGVWKLKVRLLSSESISTASSKLRACHIIWDKTLKNTEK
jgi:hypothetical protein